MLASSKGPSKGLPYGQQILLGSNAAFTYITSHSIHHTVGESWCKNLFLSTAIFFWIDLNFKALMLRAAYTVPVVALLAH